MSSKDNSIYDELKESFSDEYIKNAGILIHRNAEKFYEKFELEGKAYFDDKIFQMCLIDVLVDISRLKSFHDISNINYTKLVAYSVSWCLRRKPFQLVQGSDCDIYINEKFALYFLLQASGFSDETVDALAEQKGAIEKSIHQMFYHLKYRNTNPQTLELLLVGIDTGKKIYINN